MDSKSNFLLGKALFLAAGFGRGAVLGRFTLPPGVLHELLGAKVSIQGGAPVR